MRRAARAAPPAANAAPAPATPRMAGSIMGTADSRTGTKPRYRDLIDAEPAPGVPGFAFAWESPKVRLVTVEVGVLIK